MSGSTARRAAAKARSAIWTGSCEPRRYAACSAACRARQAEVLRHAQLFARAPVLFAGAHGRRRQRQAVARLRAECPRAIDAQVGADQLRQWAARRRMTHGCHEGAERATGNSPRGQLELIEESQGPRLLAELLSACKAYSRAARDPRKR